MPDSVLVERQLGHFVIHNNGTIDAVCGWCRKSYHMDSQLDADHLLQRIDMWLLQDQMLREVLPMLTEPERELLESGTCETCWSTMFNHPSFDPPLDDLPF